MLIQYKKKGACTYWLTMPLGLTLKDIDFKRHSIRINKDRQYHRADTPGLNEVFSKAMIWMQLSDTD